MARLNGGKSTAPVSRSHATEIARIVRPVQYSADILSTTLSFTVHEVNGTRYVQVQWCVLERLSIIARVANL